MKQPTAHSTLRRIEGWEKVTGARCYTDDLVLPGMLHGVTVRSPIARGRIKAIHFDPNVRWDEFTIVTAQDIPGKNYVALILYDQPFLAAESVNHPEEAVVLLAHPDRFEALRALQHVRLEIEPLPAVFSISDSLEKKPVIWGDDNIFKSFAIDKGNFAEAEAEADLIIEGEYETEAQEQLYIEPQGVIATFDEKDGVMVRGSLQCPYYVHKALKPLFGFVEDAKVRVIQMETGGGFGGKEEYPSMIAGHAALLARKAGRPVKMIYDRAEDMAATTKRHPSLTRHRTAVNRDGRIVGMDVDFTLDGGAYATLSAVVLSRGTLHATGPYDVSHVRLRSRAVATNTPPHGAFRGFGAPQSVFAIERHMDHIAATLGLDPVEVRRKNFLKTGQTTATGQVKHDPVDMDELLNFALEKSDFQRKRARFEIENKKGPIRRGIGLATFFHGAGFTGSGERDMKSVAAVDVTPEGKVRVLAASTEIGQGTNTIFTQIAAETLGLSPTLIEVAQPDTSVVPNSGPTVASRTVMVVGQLIESACRELEILLKTVGYEPGQGEKAFQAACQHYREVKGPLKAWSQYIQPPEVQWDNDTYQGDAYATYAWAVYVAEVSVDMRTFATKVEDFVAVQEIGRVMNPLLAAGQIEGGVAQAIGYALYEKVIWRDGRMINNRMTNYIMPTAGDLPPIRVFFEEQPCNYGPRGAKGIGELPMDGTAPAIVNAMEQALNLPLQKIPVMPEDVFAAWKEKQRD